MVKRYGQDIEWEPGRIIFRSNGPYVKYSDYEALEAKLARMVEAAESVYESGEFYGNTFECEGDPVVKLKAAIEAAKETK